MAEKYDFGNLSPIEFEALCLDLVSTETGLRFESFSEGPDGGMDGRHSSAEGDAILQAKHYKGSTWNNLQTAAKSESKNLKRLAPDRYYFATSQGLTPKRKDTLKKCLNHGAVDVADIWGLTELNALLQRHGDVEKRNIKLWLSSSSVLKRLLDNDIAIFSEGTSEEIERVLKVYVANPSLRLAAEILNDKHCVVISGPPGVGKTTLAQVLAAEYCDNGWDLVAISSIDAGLRAFEKGAKQVFVFDDFLGKIRLDERSLSKNDGKIARFFRIIGRHRDKRFILTSRAYILQAARSLSEAIDEKHIEITELVLDLSNYTREIKARILYNHLYHSEIGEKTIQELLSQDVVHRIVDHRNYMPRIIEWMTDSYRNSDVAPESYPDRFLQTLEDPSKIWEKAFFKHISSEAQALLNCIYFSEFDIFPTPGVRAKNLKRFFDNTVVNFGVCSTAELRDQIFEEALREIKSSFIVINAGHINFINPSVQDFLKSAVMDGQVIRNLAKSVTSFEISKKVWHVAKKYHADDKLDRVCIAELLIEAIKSGQVSGRVELSTLADLIGELLTTSNQPEFIEFLRSGGLLEAQWTSMSELPSVIDDLHEGRFRNLPHAPAYARLLRQKLYSYLSEREYVVEVDELGPLAANLSESFCEYPDELHEVFHEAAAEAIDCLSVSDIGEDESIESIIGDWIDNIEKIELFAPDAVRYGKKEELESYLIDITMRYEEEMTMYKDERSLQRSSSSDSGISLSELKDARHPTFSDSDMSAMFSSLRK